VLVDVLPQPRVIRLIQHGQVHVGKIDDGDIEPGVVLRAPGEPLRDRHAGAPWPGRADDDGQVRHRSVLPAEDPSPLGGGRVPGDAGTFCGRVARQTGNRAGWFGPAESG